ncbi:hypothetical protein BDW02DRAFT_333659 [Decorospora gaudefroyi]|uniref:Uncharacterized protein n=1 Tax=Decorospora gaudefroyi TaxID=184978 RepID=A0A6A5KDJ9_9PLEO|nr:hypothetical protein BDW02DRAFT_333659 [Decorospora gaudefroyi]
MAKHSNHNGQFAGADVTQRGDIGVDQERVSRQGQGTTSREQRWREPYSGVDKSGQTVTSRPRRCLDKFTSWYKSPGAKFQHNLRMLPVTRVVRVPHYWHHRYDPNRCHYAARSGGPASRKSGNGGLERRRAIDGCHRRSVRDQPQRTSTLI